MKSQISSTGFIVNSETEGQNVNQRKSFCINQKVSGSLKDKMTFEMGAIKFKQRIRPRVRSNVFSSTKSFDRETELEFVDYLIFHELSDKIYEFLTGEVVRDISLEDLENLIEVIEAENEGGWSIQRNKRKEKRDRKRREKVKESKKRNEAVRERVESNGRYKQRREKDKSLAEQREWEKRKLTEKEKKLMDMMMNIC